MSVLMKEHGYVDGEWQAEGPEHIAMKNTAAMILMSLGFREDEITEERSLQDGPVDMAAEYEDGSLLLVECETKPRTAPPRENQVTFNKRDFDEGHQVFALIESGLYELVDRQARQFVPVKDIQTKLGAQEKQHVGRWVADGTEKAEIGDPADHVKWSNAHSRGWEITEDMIEDNHSRWRANGVEPQESQPSIWAVVGESDFAPSRTAVSTAEDTDNHEKTHTNTEDN